MSAAVLLRLKLSVTSVETPSLFVEHTPRAPRLVNSQLLQAFSPQLKKFQAIFISSLSYAQASY